jgi:hypothetical protein
VTSVCADVPPADVMLALRSVPGVAGADLEPDETGGPGLLRLDLAPDVDEVTVAAAVGRVLRERFGLQVDAGLVQLVENAGQVAVDVHQPAVEWMQLVSAGRHVTARVSLRRRERAAVGEARETATPAGVYVAVAAATLHAVEELTDDVVCGRVENATVTDGRARVELALETDGDDELVGAEAPVRRDPRQAVIRAVLAALDGRLPA